MDLASLVHGFDPQRSYYPPISSCHHFDAFCQSSSSSLSSQSPMRSSSVAGDTGSSSFRSHDSNHQEECGSNSGRTSSPPTSPDASSKSCDGQEQRHNDDDQHLPRFESHVKSEGAVSFTRNSPQPTSSPPASIQPSYFYPMDSNDPTSHKDESGVPVFEPTMEQFQDFYQFCQAIDHWGMKSGIVKIIPPKEWTEALPSLRAAHVAQQKEQTTASGSPLPNLESVRIKSAIAQHFIPAAKPGLWKQTNVTRPAKVWNAKQWADVCRSLSGPSIARVKEMSAVREMMEKGTESTQADSSGIRTRSGKHRAVPADKTTAVKPSGSTGSPSPKKRKITFAQFPRDDVAATSSSSGSQAIHLEVEGASHLDDSSPLQADSNIDAVKAVTPTFATPPLPGDNGEGNQTPPLLAHVGSTAPVAKPKFADLTSGAEWDAFDYRTAWLKEWQTEQGSADDESGGDHTQFSASDLSPGVCREIEGEYWRGLNFGKPPMYGADLKGSLFTPLTTSWNVSNLDNLLTRLKLKRKIAGVTDPYLYFGMWRATFAWHVEDMDLYSINYVHFGAPKQWYAIPQKDRLRFETALASVFPSDARRCSQFMRHKSFLASPSFLAANNIRPIKVVQHAQEFVITYPFGYHSGYNLGFNCAESVNFALESWLDIGRKAKACDCEDAQQSVTMDVDALLEESEELKRAEKRREDKKRKAEEQVGLGEERLRKKEEARIRKNERSRLKRLQTMQTAAAHTAKHSFASPFKAADMDLDGRGEGSSKSAVGSTGGKSGTDGISCVFCPSDMADDMIPIPLHQVRSQDTLYAHRFCASSIPETWVAQSEGQDGLREEVQGYANISKARWSLRCSACPTPELAKQGCCMQCTFGNCSKAAHASCATMESTGWMYEYFPSDEADKLEGKGRYASKLKKSKAGKRAAFQSVGPASLQPDISNPSPPAPDATAAGLVLTQSDSSLVEAEADDRLVVLCRAHNPQTRDSDAARRSHLLAECARHLRVGQQVQIKSSGGSWETIVLALGDANYIIIDGGRNTRLQVKWDKIIFPADTVAAAKTALSKAETRGASPALSVAPSAPPTVVERGSDGEEKVEAIGAMGQFFPAVSAAPLS